MSSTFSRRNVLQLSMGAAAISLLAACGAKTDEAGANAAVKEAVEIKVGYIADYNGAALMAVADQEGYWAKAGLTPKYLPFTNGPLAIQALGTDNIDVAYIGSGALWLPASGKAEIWAVNSVSNADRIIAQPGYKTLADLKGKKVAVPAGTSGDQLFSLALKKEGLTREDFEVTAMEPPAIVAAFASKQVDGAALWYPLIDSAKKGQPDLVELYSNEDFIDQLTFPSTFVAGPGRAAKDKELATNFISVVKSANDYRHANQDTTIALTATFLKLKEEDMKAQAGVAKLFTSKELETLSSEGTVYTWLNALQEQFKTAEKIKEVVDPKTFYNSELFVSAPKV
ncbi:aliphatic sulfonate ABC transporter substrate-binding protein [Arthrobacter glacialis]|uniref:Aliphatic sulfonates ABC transporter substrate-binding protein n=1 Tax=Arthrobacter glacialis TaxID=1664 RepID=A0A2S3ZWJ3_ARTGL|nr:aliphatic sulfonate ABC transporter substrate-binding protein [Arthrobacter glacialis]POH58511.1 aliphatic sulfonates ABC transporter substrate-binding protein [Arthrobacter glacialis]POH73312.1 aliphatic sulfonates ABC transporter substrate-binding protein [Arthrobacter glacialis]